MASINMPKIATIAKIRFMVFPFARYYPHTGNDCQLGVRVLCVWFIQIEDGWAAKFVAMSAADGGIFHIEEVFAAPTAHCYFAPHAEKPLFYGSIEHQIGAGILA